MSLYDDYRMCYGKRAYKYGTALGIIERRKDDDNLRVYHCPICHKYHVTKRPESDGKA